MSFDGVPRPTQLNAYSDPLSSYLASNEASEEARRKSQIKDIDKLAKSNPSRRKDEEDGFDGDDPGSHKRWIDYDLMSEEERELFRKFAQVRGLMNFSLESGARYSLQINTQTGMVDLVEQGTGQIKLSLTPTELHELSQRMERYAGIMTDRSA